MHYLLDRTNRLRRNLTSFMDDEGTFEVDEAIVPVIMLLNQKGYETEFCCSGHSRINFILENSRRAIITEEKHMSFIHMYDTQEEFEISEEDLQDLRFEQQYVMFAKEYNFETLPEGWKINNEGLEENKTLIEHFLEIDPKYVDYDKKELIMNPFMYYEILEDILDNMKKLYKWALSLPDFINHEE